MGKGGFARHQVICQMLYESIMLMHGNVGSATMMVWTCSMARAHRFHNSPSDAAFSSHHSRDHRYLFEWLASHRLGSFGDTPLPSPNSFIVSFTGLRNRFFAASFSATRS